MGKLTSAGPQKVDEVIRSRAASPSPYSLPAAAPRSNLGQRPKLPITAPSWLNAPEEMAWAASWDRDYSEPGDLSTEVGQLRGGDSARS